MVTFVRKARATNAAGLYSIKREGRRNGSILTGVAYRSEASTALATTPFAKVPLVGSDATVQEALRTDAVGGVLERLVQRAVIPSGSAHARGDGSSVTF